MYQAVDKNQIMGAGLEEDGTSIAHYHFTYFCIKTF